MAIGTCSATRHRLPRLRAIRSNVCEKNQDRSLDFHQPQLRLVTTDSSRNLVESMTATLPKFKASLLKRAFVELPESILIHYLVSGKALPEFAYRCWSA